MKKGDIIHGYRILEDFSVAGGMSTISFAERGGKQYFIKEFLAPKYPVPGSPGSDKIKAQKKKACEEFEQHQRKINSLIASKVSLGGNLIYAVDFFREGAFYYKINEKIDTASLSPKEISSLPFEKITIIARSVCKSIGILHDIQIVHGDLKPDNILIKETSKENYTGKLIDFDDSYFSEKPPASKLIVGTPEYYSPELGLYITEKDSEFPGKELTLASDIFTLGIIFSEYFTGEKPITGTSFPTWQAVIKGCPISFSKTIDPLVADLIKSMLSAKPQDRPTIKKIQQKLREIKEGRITSSHSGPVLDKKSTTKVRIRIGKGLEHKTKTPLSSDIHDKKEPTSEPKKDKGKVGIRGRGLKIADK